MTCAALQIATAIGENVMNAHDGSGENVFNVGYLMLSGTTTTLCCPELLRELLGLGFQTVIAVPHRLRHG